MKAWTPLLFVLCACGIDDAGLLPPGGTDASSDAPNDVVVPPDAQKEAGPPQACSVDAGACVASLPAGWSLVAFDPSNENTCPSNYGSVTVVSNVTALTGACDCGCTVTTTPVCDVGSLQRFVSNDNSCNMTGVTLTVNGGGCTAYPSTTLDAFSKSSPLAASGGACTGSAIKNATDFGVNKGAACSVPPACQEQFCGGDVPGGFESCIETAGEQACPAGWSTPVFVGDDYSFDCSTCACDVNGASTCTGASLDIFGNSQCSSNQLLVTMPVDGACDADQASGKSPSAFEYHATLTQNCSATGAKTASNVKLSNEHTICCK